MMKWIFGLLIAVNLVFFALMQWGSALMVDTTPPTQAPAAAKTSNQAAAWSPPVAPAEASATRFTHAQKGAWHELRKPSRS